MAFPVGAALGLGAGIAGFFSDKAKNKRAKEELALQKQLADQQIDISKYIQQLSKDLMAKGTAQVDPYGGRTGYDTATGTYYSTLGEGQQALQRASDAEEAQRLGVDQVLRRRAMQDAEGLRADASSAGRTALGDLQRFKQGVGRVDPERLASIMRLDRQGAVNAGYDDAERAASTLQLRTGSSAIGDALNRIATDRVRAQAQIGNPEVEALTTAEGLNRGRLGDLSGLYDMFSNKGSQYNDVAFTPSPYAAIADSKVADNMKFDLSKYDVAQGGSGTAAAGIGSAAAGIRQGYQLSEANRIHAPLSKFLTGLSNNTDSLTSLAKLFG